MTCRQYAILLAVVACVTLAPAPLLAYLPWCECYTAGGSFFKGSCMPAGTTSCASYCGIFRPKIHTADGRCPDFSSTYKPYNIPVAGPFPKDIATALHESTPVLALVFFPDTPTNDPAVAVLSILG